MNVRDKGEAPWKPCGHSNKGKKCHNLIKMLDGVLQVGTSPLRWVPYQLAQIKCFKCVFLPVNYMYFLSYSIILSFIFLSLVFSLFLSSFNFLVGERFQETINRLAHTLCKIVQYPYKHLFQQ